MHYSTFKKLVVETVGKVAMQIDGDPAGTTPATFEVVPASLKVIVPRDVPQTLFSQVDERQETVVGGEA